MGKPKFEHKWLGKLLLMPQNPAPTARPRCMATAPDGLSSNNRELNAAVLAIPFIQCRAPASCSPRVGSSLQSLEEMLLAPFPTPENGGSERQSDLLR